MPGNSSLYIALVALLNGLDYFFKSFKAWRIAKSVAEALLSAGMLYEIYRYFSGKSRNGK